MRSKTFTIEKTHILYKASGHGVRVNVVIDGFQQIRDPIYGRLTFAIGGSRWYVQNVSMWVGQRAYVELLDDGDGGGGFDRILFSDSSQPPADGPNAFWLRFLDDEALTNAEALAEKYRSALTELVLDIYFGIHLMRNKLTLENKEPCRIGI